MSARPAPARRHAAGAMYEINFLVWPLVYGVAGYAWGLRVGWPFAMAVLGGVVGVFTAVPLVSRLYYDVEILAPFLLAATWLFPAEYRLAWLSLLCLLPWLRMALGAAVIRLRKAPGDS